MAKKQKELQRKICELIESSQVSYQRAAKICQISADSITKICNGSDNSLDEKKLVKIYRALTEKLS